MQHDDLVLRQQRLLLRSAQLRLDLREQLNGFQKPLLMLDKVQSGLHWIYRNPAWPTAALLALLVLRPQRTLKWVTRLWWAWGAYQRARNWTRHLPRSGRAL
jgi:hypothetical protein